MYSAARPALRASARRPPARFICGRRYPSSSRIRSFHSTGCLFDSQTPPPGADDAPVSNDGVDRKGKDKATAEQADAGVATEDPQVLAQKLQRSREMTRRYSSALRRSQRRNRAQDLPPVVVPDWFLKKRVLVAEEGRAHPLYRLGQHEITLFLQRRTSKEAGRMSIPLGSLSSGTTALSQFVFSTWNSALGPEQKRRVARQLASRLGFGDDERVVQALEKGEDPDATQEELRRALTSRLEPLKQQLTEVRDLIVDSETESLLKINAHLLDQEKEIEQWSRDYEALMRQKNRSNEQIPAFVLAEIRATIAAALTALPTATGDLFPSTKTNLILHSPSNEHDRLLSKTILSIASELSSDVVVLQAQDLADLAGDYLGDGPEPSPHSIRSLGYETYRLSTELGNDFEELGKDDPYSDEQDEAVQPQSSPVFPRSAFKGTPTPMPISILAFSPVFKTITQTLQALRAPTVDPGVAVPQEPQARAQTQAEVQLEDLKLTNLLESLIEATEVKLHRSFPAAEMIPQSAPIPEASSSTPNTSALFDTFFNYSMTSSGDKVDLSLALTPKAVSRYSLAMSVSASTSATKSNPRSKIIYIKDIKELNATSYGNRIIQRLEDIVRKRRSAGESIMLVGTTCSLDLTPDLSASVVRGLQSEGEASFFRTIVIPIEPTTDPIATRGFNHGDAHQHFVSSQKLLPAERKKFRSINLRHIQSMLRCLDPTISRSISDREQSLEELRAATSLLPETYFSKVLTYDEVHRIALGALGLYRMDTSPKELNWAHVALAMGLLKVSDEVKVAYIKRVAEQLARGDAQTGDSYDRWQKGVENVRNVARGDEVGATTTVQRERQLQNISQTATKHEKRLLPGIANPDQIKTTFDQVHVPPDTIDSIRTLTSMSLLRPDAFNYGVLATEKISGALLYGPPGTGKTLLAKAVAKESGCTVLEVSGSQIMDKYVGEGEKNVAAVFSLARKLTPCIVFLDEADAIFASRDAARERTSHRDVLNQFLKEWDGLSDLSVFVMVATNRPFDLDDAVIRRLPRRLLVDLPTQADRKEILKIHLRGEQLDESVDLDSLAERTPFYSGSDLKNLAVSAALACVKEENEQAAIGAAKAAAGEAGPVDVSRPPQLVRGQRYSFPEKRILHARHFDKALVEISASISEDMASLNAIKKFDEKYGDKKGKKKKSVYGFGIETGTNENAARVRT